MSGESKDWKEIFTPDQLAFCKGLPKVELHAHLNGSIRRSTLEELYKFTWNNEANMQDQTSSYRIVKGDTRTLPEMFTVFSIVHQVVRGADLLRRVTREVLEDMQDDGIIYAELRTTPKEHTDRDLSKRDYVEAVLAGINDHHINSAAFIGRLILSIDRKDSPQTAMETVQLAIHFKTRGVVGVDLCGNPADGKGQWQAWLPAFQLARQNNLKITLHCAEMQGMDEETASMLHFHPDRLGHVCFLSQQHEQLVKDMHIPIELCLTSNVLCNTTKSYPRHHFSQYHRKRQRFEKLLSPIGQTKAQNHPILLSTDDSLVFGSPLSREYALAMAAFELTEAEISSLARDAFRWTFLEGGNDREKLLLPGDGPNFSHY